MSREILSVRDQSNENHNNKNGLWSLAASEAYHAGNVIASGAAGLGRELRLVGEGVVLGAVKEGVAAFTQRPKETLLNLAETVGIGSAMALASKAGPMPIKMLALGAGAYFGYNMIGWVKNDVFNGDRWSAIGGAMGDAWKSGKNMSRNINDMQHNAGLLAFDAALMFGGGKLGAKLGAGAARPLSQLDFSRFGLSKLQIRRGSIGFPDKRGRGRAAEEPESFGKARRIIDVYSAGEITARDLGDLRKLADIGRERKLANADSKARQLATESIPGLLAKYGELQSKGGRLETSLRTAQNKLREVETLSAETRESKKADADVASLRQAEKDLPNRRAELQKLQENLKELRAQQKTDSKSGKKKAGANKGAGDEKINTCAEKTRQLMAEIAETERAIDKTNPESAINKAIKSQSDSKNKIEQARKVQSGRMGAIRSEIETIKANIAENKAAQTELDVEMQTLVKAYNDRIVELMGSDKASGGAKATQQAEAIERRESGENSAPATAATEQSVPENVIAEPVQSGTLAHGGENPAYPGIDAIFSKARQQAGAAVSPAPEAVPQGQTATSTAPIEAAAGMVDAPGSQKATENTAAEKPASAKVPLAGVEQLKNEFDTANALVERYRQGVNQGLERERIKHNLEVAEKALNLIKTGKQNFSSNESRNAKIAELEAKRDTAMQALKEAPKVGNAPNFFGTLRGIYDYAAAAERRCMQEQDPSTTAEVARRAVGNLEGLLDKMPDSRRGIRNVTGDLSRSGKSGNETQRLAEIRKHLEMRITGINIDQMPVVKEAFNLVENTSDLGTMIRIFLDEGVASSMTRMSKPRGMGEKVWKATQAKALAAEGLSQQPVVVKRALDATTIVFFDANGNLLHSKGTDGSYHPMCFDYSQLVSDKCNAARVDRLKGRNPVGYAVVAPRGFMTDRGQAVLKEFNSRGHNRHGHGLVFDKAVVCTGGIVPASVKSHTPFGEVLRLRPDANQGRSNQARNAANPVAGKSEGHRGKHKPNQHQSKPGGDGKQPEQAGGRSQAQQPQATAGDGAATVTQAPVAQAPAVADAVPAGQLETPASAPAAQEAMAEAPVGATGSFADAIAATDPVAPAEKPDAPASAPGPSAETAAGTRQTKPEAGSQTAN